MCPIKGAWLSVVLQAVPDLGLPCDDSETPERGFLVLRFWHQCKPCTVGYRGAVAPVVFVGYVAVAAG